MMLLSYPVHRATCRMMRHRATYRMIYKPVMRKRLFTRQRITHSASCKDLSASSMTSLLLPLRRMVVVRPLFRIPVTFTTRPLPTWEEYKCHKENNDQNIVCQSILTVLPLPSNVRRVCFALTSTSSTMSAVPSFSGFMWSTWAMGRQLSVLLTNSISLRSMSRITIILALACKFKLRFTWKDLIARDKNITSNFGLMIDNTLRYASVNRVFTLVESDGWSIVIISSSAVSHVITLSYDTSLYDAPQFLYLTK